MGVSQTAALNRGRHLLVIVVLTFCYTHVGVLGRLSQQKHVERHVRGRRSLSGAVCRPSTAADPRRRPVAVTDDWPAAAARFCQLLRNENIQQLEVI